MTFLSRKTDSEPLSVGASATVAIVGGGASGTLLAAQLLRQAEHPVRILLFDPLPLPEIGTAYTTVDEAHLLNVRAGGMSALPDDPDHFVRWLNAPSNCASLVKKRSFGPQDFVARSIYARYISHVLEASVETGRTVGAKFQRVRDFVVDFVVDEGGAGVLRTSGGREVRTSHLVLALGNLPPRNPLPRPHAFFRSSRYTSGVWSPGALQEIDRAEDLFLAGSGLTMLDTVATLHRCGHRGRITVVSRNGQLPALHKAAPPYDDFPAHTAWPRSVLGWLRLVRDEVALAEEAGVDWRPVIDALRRHTPKIWQMLSLVEKRRFLRHVRPYWESRRHRAAPATWEAFEHFRGAGQLVFRPGRILDFIEETDHVTVVFQPKGSREPAEVSVHRVLNCIGPESNFRHHINDPLLVNLLARGLVDTDPLLLGLAATPEGVIIGADGIPNPMISTLGPPLRGILWESTAIPEIRRQASFLANDILQSLFVPAWEI
jgi:uncharacterized NAD(P)/FAD-binding protein YdhS